MRFDDRLLTVLNQPAEDRHDAAVRWRQLVDLVARAGSNSASPVVADALEAIRNEARWVEETIRAAAARAVAALPLPLGLLEYFATDALAVSAPILAAAILDEHQWQVVRQAANEETRHFIATLHPELSTEPYVEPAPTTGKVESLSPTPEPTPYAPPSLHEVVERIERRRRLREGPSGPAIEPPAALQAAPLFRWECGPGGEIVWVEGAPRGPLIGRSIARSLGDDRIDQEATRAFAIRAPFRDAVMAIAGGGALAGDWKISAVPAFEPSDGRFAGYRGVALRDVSAPASEMPSRETMPEMLTDPDSLRELVHEIKTPLNAIIGFAEIIEGQYLGPADRGYRDRAAEIVRQAHLLLAAIDDLDFAAKVHSTLGRTRERVDLGALIMRAADEFRRIAVELGVKAEVVRPRGEIAAAVEPELADRLLFRLFNTLVERAERGEHLYLSAQTMNDAPRIAMTRPKSLRDLGEKELFDPTLGGEGVHGRFPLRLARGLARIAGGDLATSRDSFALVFPRA